MNDTDSRTPHCGWYRCLTCTLSILALTLLASCEHIELANTSTDEDNNPTHSITPPLQTGSGTAEAPFTVTDLIQGADTLIGRRVWVIGYAVGETYQRLANAIFTPPFQYTSNILIADSKECATTSLCLPVELKSSSQKQQVSLSNNPRHHKHCILLQGTVQKYFSVTGLRTLTDYVWLPDYIIPNSTPTEWEEELVQF